ncbi:PLDc N-terminal domain-containing protein [Paenibacillus typhae]|uniref:Phospholipase_D-nuclease N-terminal n=1 Tax=Paenibacillus typhae TaxID=1174501 RepID=A0A1G8JCE6_9BACL|nr:PLDc N-terminal domain-containing protein [Paenibacillus typhae]SDI28928.1 Phospholipase_D-nuclease N-terminal [Paenibacillus typhae]
MKNRIELEKWIFWVLTTVVVLGFIAFFIVMAPSMYEVFGDGDGWIFVIAGLTLLYIALNVLIAVFIYKDACRRKMNPWLWMLAVIYIPNFIGLLLYLFARRRQHIPAAADPGTKPVQCPHCGNLIHP